MIEYYNKHDRMHCTLINKNNRDSLSIIEL